MLSILSVSECRCVLCCSDEEIDVHPYPFSFCLSKDLGWFDHPLSIPIMISWLVVRSSQFSGANSCHMHGGFATQLKQYVWAHERPPHSLFCDSWLVNLAHLRIDLVYTRMHCGDIARAPSWLNVMVSSSPQHWNCFQFSQHLCFIHLHAIKVH